ncbi:hypothetical protein K0U07_01565 [bacterium]|nr:hypothetical protein [bacterium]
MIRNWALTATTHVEVGTHKVEEGYKITSTTTSNLTKDNLTRQIQTCADTYVKYLNGAAKELELPDTDLIKTDILIVISIKGQIFAFGTTTHAHSVNGKIQIQDGVARWHIARIYLTLSQRGLL